MEFSIGNLFNNFRNPQVPEHLQGLLSVDNMRNAQAMGLLGAAAAMAQGSTSNRPVRLGQLIAPSIAAGVGGYQDSINNNMKSRLAEMQMRKYQRDDAAERGRADAMSALFGGTDSKGITWNSGLEMEPEEQRATLARAFPEQFAQATVKKLFPDPVEAKSELGQLAQDYKNGLITEDQLRAGIRKATTIKGGGDGSGGYGGPFAGNSMDAQTENILLRGVQDPAFRATPEYAAAFNIRSQPRLVRDQDGQVVEVRPNMSIYPTPHYGAPAPASAADPLTQVTQGDTERVSTISIGPRRLDPARMKMLEETEDNLSSAESAARTLQKALVLNPEAYDGVGASTRAMVASNSVPWETPAADATVEYERLVGEQALANLKAIFGGNPTEGERKILMDLQASVNKTEAQRQAALTAAIEAVQRRADRFRNKITELKTGQYGVIQPEVNTSTSGRTRIRLDESGEIIQ